MTQLKRKSNLLFMLRCLYNIDVVGAKTGKKLSLVEKFVNAAINYVAGIITILVVIVFLGFIVFFIYKVIMFFLNT